jgi:YD repeat-containing protein
MKKVFLGGTCNNSTWRDELIPMLEVPYFNPVVADWTPECQAEELRQRESCDYCLYVITPEMTGVYSIAEVTDDSNKRPYKTLFCFLTEANGKEFDEPQIKSLKATSKLIKENGAKVFESLKEVADWINSSHIIPPDSNLTCHRNSDGDERWNEYDSNGNRTHYKDSNGYEWWCEYDSNGNVIEAKTSLLQQTEISHD